MCKTALALLLHLTNKKKQLCVLVSPCTSKYSIYYFYSEAIIAGIIYSHLNQYCLESHFVAGFSPVLRLTTSIFEWPWSSNKEAVGAQWYEHQWLGTGTNGQKLISMNHCICKLTATSKWWLLNIGRLILEMCSQSSHTKYVICLDITHKKKPQTLVQ